MRIISDVHGKVDDYYKIASKAKYSVQLGDFSVYAKDFEILKKLDHNCHKINFGNHDHYPLLYSLPHSLGDYGMWTLNDIPFFAVRGSISIDYRQRIAYEKATGIKTWFENEELTLREGMECLLQYETIKPDFVLSHDCPIEIKNKISNSTSIIQSFGFHPNYCCSTQNLLQQMLEIHRPELWIFGHWHKNRDFTWRGTRFICMDELDYIDVNKELEIVRK